MTRRMIKLTSLYMSLMILLLIVRPAAAGGWVVISLDELPGPVRAGETVRLGFTVRQHGVTPVNSVTPMLMAVNPQTGETITAEAEQVGATGHFEVATVFPEAGAWEWQLSAPPFPQETRFEPITVLPAAASQSAFPFGNSAGQARTAMRWAGAGLLGVAVVLAYIGRRRRPTEAPSPEAAGSAL